MAQADSNSTSEFGTDAHFQAFRAPDEKELILIPVSLHPTLNELYVIWSDITNCFPETRRIQFRNVYVPLLRDTRLYRVKPHGIKYHPGVVLDIIYGKRPSSFNNNNNNSNNNSTSKKNRINDTQDAIVKTEDPTAGATPPGQDRSSSGQAKKEENLDDYIGGETLARIQEGAVDGDQEEEGKGNDEADCAEEKLETQIEEQEEDSTVGSDAMSQNSATQSTQQSTERPTERLKEQLAARTIEQPTVLPTQPATKQVTLTSASNLPPAMDNEKMKIKEESSPVQELPVVHARRTLPFTIEDVVKHRVKDIFKARYSWTQHCGHSRFFCFLPRVMPTPTGEVAAPGIQSNTDFEFFDLCDCADVPGSKGDWRPHWIGKKINDSFYPVSAEDLSQDQVRGLLPLVGDYVMGVLEMLKYGVYIDKIPQDVAYRISSAIEYLESKGVRSCEGFMTELSSSDPAVAITESMLEQLPPIAALDEKGLVELKDRLERYYNEDEYSDLYPFRTSEGDVRRMCEIHWKSMWLDKELEDTLEDFHDNPMSIESRYEPLFGIWSMRVKNLQRALEYFKLAEKVTWMPVFTIWLDWDLTEKDEAQLAQAVDLLTAAVFHVLARRREVTREDIRLGFGCGYSLLIGSALGNPNIETFSLSTQEPNTEYDYHEYGEGFDTLQMYEPRSQDRIAMVERGVKGAKMKAMLMASDMDLALETVPSLVGGYDRFSELRIGLIATHPDHITIKVAESGAQEDMANIRGDLVSFYEKRQWRDEISIVSNLQFERNAFLAGYLTMATFQVSLSKNGSAIRSLITLNKHLKSLTLESLLPLYNPSQAYETCKQPLFDHPAIELFRITCPNEGPRPSTFVWRHPNDPDKMRVDIFCCRADDVEAMFQRYAPLIDRLEVEWLSSTDAVALEKMARRKKRPLAPKYISIKDVHLMEPAVRTILQEVIAKGAMESVVVQGTIMPQVGVLRNGAKEDVSKLAARLEANVKIWAQFLGAIRCKVTELTVQDGAKKQFLKEMELQIPMLPDMPRLKKLHLSCAAAELNLFKMPWLRLLLLYKGPKPQEVDSSVRDPFRTHALNVFAQRSQLPDLRAITDLRLREVTMGAEDWKQFLPMVEFSQVVKFEVHQKNVLSKETLLQIAEFVPMNSTVLKSFVVIDGKGTDDDTSAALEAKFGPPKLDGVEQAFINLNWFII
ncbi:hypothetical protein K457DRAFT_158055 [Linnemannia elongata AG-77]|uniref:Uncharacterized protein n=1 Tax=Linnemannia elongata AG-77 TaxID=1314771 RepID=A0A197JLF8_9FUNG|nr:hypothetical protein K457DRAFT_158055 [Linnemannia elongata AG-77]